LEKIIKMFWNENLDKKLKQTFEKTIQKKNKRLRTKFNEIKNFVEFFCEKKVRQKN
jgi:CRISPR/Cas system CMR-associated protein Cmr1 (group 7 of RAMP superfamily)